MSAENSTLGFPANAKTTEEPAAAKSCPPDAAPTYPAQSIEDVRMQLARMRAHFDSGATLALEARRAALLITRAR